MRLARRTLGWGPLEQLVARVLPGARMLDARPLRPDSSGGSGRKAFGYGVPMLLRVVAPSGVERSLVLHFESANDFGHDRRADRAANVLLAWDTFGGIPNHARPLDVGATTSEGGFQSLRDAGELYLLTEWVEGRPYADDLREIGSRGAATRTDVDRAAALARYLVGLHQRTPLGKAPYVRAIRDLVGHGEGIFGIVDGYPPDTPEAPPARLRAIEQACVEWRWRLRGREDRLRRTHGDFHPFNVLFDPSGSVGVLDASRGGRGDPADDVFCMAVNFPFFALGAPGSWASGYRPLWKTFFDTYLEATGDRGVLEVAAPFLAWRTLVLCNPRWYPTLSPAARAALLGFAETALAAPAFDPESVEAIFP